MIRDTFLHNGTQLVCKGRPALSLGTYNPPPPPTSYPYPTYTDRQVIPYSALYQSGDSVNTVLTTRLSAYGDGSGGYVTLPNGFDEEMSDFLQGGTAYSIYAPKCYGIWGNGPTQARLKLKNGSSTQGGQVPAQGSGGINPLSVIRLSGSGATTQYKVHMYGLTLEGGNVGHTYNGLMAYWNAPGSTYEWMVMKGFGHGDWNSPPGETNMFNTYRGGGILVRGVEADGFRSDGTRSGCAFASNGADGITYEDVNVHDVVVSGVTFGTAGSVTTGTLTRNVRTLRMRSWNNANHSNTGGQRFSGINHEGGYDVEHWYPDIFIKQTPYGNKEHVSINSSQLNSRLLIQEPNWHGTEGGSPAWAYGCFAVSIDAGYIDQKQDASMVTIIKNGVTLTPRSRALASSANPALHYILADTSI